MSDESPDAPPVLRREALLPAERNRGLGSVAIVCTMAGVASGLALATTLMAMQVANTMATRGSTYETSCVHTPTPGFLGVEYNTQRKITNGVRIERVVAGSPADAVSLRPGDLIVAINGDPLDSVREMQAVHRLGAGAQPILTVERDGERRLVRPTLMLRPKLRY